VSRPTTSGQGNLPNSYSNQRVNESHNSGNSFIASGNATGAGKSMASTTQQMST